MAQYLNPPSVSPDANVSSMWTMVDTALEYADVVTADYLGAQQAKGHVFNSSDTIYVSYVGGSGWFSMSISSGIITLVGVAIIVGGNVQAGSSGVVGYVSSFPSAATSGSLRMQGVANSGDYVVTISNASHAQATVYSIPDVGASTGQFLVKTSALVDGNFVSASGTAGKTADSGYNVNNVLLYASVAITAAEFNGMYAAPKLVVAAPGANNLIVVDRVELIMTYGSAAFAAGGVVGFQYDSTVHGAGVAASNTEAAADFFQTASTTFAFNGNSGNTVGLMPLSTTVNKGLYLSNLTQAFTTGTGSSFVCKIHYRIVATV